AESRSMQVLREKTDIQTRLEEVEEDLNDVMKKYKAAVQQVSDLKIAHAVRTTNPNGRQAQSGEAGGRRHVNSRGPNWKAFEITTRQRLETSLARSKEQVHRLTSEKEEINMHKLTIDELGSANAYRSSFER
ncbi:hypothetical protein RRG08_020311, partial [Elysia crispata]